MSRVCEITKKKKQFGNTRQHSRNSGWRFRAPTTKRTWSVNVRSVKVKFANGRVRIVNMSMKAYKRFRKDGLNFLHKHGIFS